MAVHQCSRRAEAREIRSRRILRRRWADVSRQQHRQESPSSARTERRSSIPACRPTRAGTRDRSCSSGTPITVRFATASDMLAELAAQDSLSILARRLSRYTSPQLLCVDESEVFPTLPASSPWSTASSTGAEIDRNQSRQLPSQGSQGAHCSSHQTKNQEAASLLNPRPVHR
jgi:hypothetical protein